MRPCKALEDTALILASLLEEFVAARRWIIIFLLMGAFRNAYDQTDQEEHTPASHQPDTAQTAAPALPRPTGPFGIGRVGYEWIDTSRPDAFASRTSDRRDLMVYLWYPASRTGARQKAPYLPGAKLMDGDPEVQHQAKEDFGPGWNLMVSGSLSSHAIENAPVTLSPRQFPVVLFSHGLGSTGFAYTSLIEDLVSHGYVVASIEHTGTALAIEFPNGRLVPFRREPVSANLTPQQRFEQMQTSAGRAIDEGAHDVVFVLSMLAEMNSQNRQNFALSQKLDLDRVAAMGQSAGGAFAALACQMDQRFKACISLDGALPPVAAFPEYGKGFTQPVLLLEVDHSGQPKGFDDAQQATYLKKKVAQLSACPPGSYDIVLKSAGLNHSSFSDVPILFANGKEAETEAALYNLRATQAFTRSFLDKTLMRRSGELLDHPLQYPGTVVTPYGH